MKRSTNERQTTGFYEHSDPAIIARRFIAHFLERESAFSVNWDMSRASCLLSLCPGLIAAALTALPAGAAELGSAVPAGVQAGQVARFNRGIRPLLSDNCFYCHGPDSTHRKEGLRLDREEGLFGPRDNGPAFVKGKPQESQACKRIVSEDPDELMPPPTSNKKLTAAQKETIRRWVEQGATWEPLWSFVAPVRPALPEVKGAGWVQAISGKLWSAGFLSAECAGVALRTVGDPRAIEKQASELSGTQSYQGSRVVPCRSRFVFSEGGLSSHGQVAAS